MKNIVSLLFTLAFFLTSCSFLKSKTSLENINSNAQEECLKKNFKACTLMASVHIEAQQFEAAKVLYKVACENGEATACYLLGERLIVEGLLVDALPYFKKACDQKFIYACRRVHFVNFQKLPIDHINKNDFEECKKKNAKACLAIAYAYSGSGNYSRAKNLFQKACDLGEVIGACFELGAIEYYQGNVNAAKKDYQMACGKKNGDACRLLDSIK